MILNRRHIHVLHIFVLQTACLTGLGADDDPRQTLSVPVKLLPSRAGNAAQPMPNPGTAPATQPTTPGGKLPQYQLEYDARSVPDEEALQNPRLRLILALPSAPVLMEATIRIDGKPFRMIREQRITRILEQVNRPAAEVSAQTATEEPIPSDVRDSDEPDKDDTEQDEDETEPDSEPVAEPTVAPYALAATVPERIRRYVQATGETPSRGEMRWHLANWVDGPTLLMLNDHFQQFRANQKPAFQVLDRNRDNTISREEIERAVASFNECDLNRDDLVDYTEIARVADDPRLKTNLDAGPGKLVYRIPDERTAAATYRRLASQYATSNDGSADTIPRFDRNANGRLDSDELDALRTGRPDLNLTIEFHSASPAESRMAITAAGPDFTSAVQAGRADATTITLPLAGTSVAFSAVQSAVGDQISVGAVNDGYPILPVIDPNDDGRFTIRELRQLIDRLKAFDRNQDGGLTADETQSTIRICFGLGPHVHRELAGIRSLNPAPSTPAVKGPEWFVSMDRNGDNDLTRREFPGNDQQFADFDTDGDELISAEEALNSDRKSSGTSNDSELPESDPAETTSPETE